MRSKWLTDCSPLSLGVVGAATDISPSVSAPGTTQFPVCGFFSTFPAVRDLQATGLHRQHSVEVYTSTAYWPDDRESLNVSIKFKALNYARYKALYWTVWSSYSHCASEECYTHVSLSMCLVVVRSVDVHRRCEVWHMMSGPDSWHCPLSSDSGLKSVPCSGGPTSQIWWHSSTVLQLYSSPRQIDTNPSAGALQSWPDQSGPAIITTCWAANGVSSLTYLTWGVNQPTNQRPASPHSSGVNLHNQSAPGKSQVIPNFYYWERDRH